MKNLHRVLISSPNTKSQTTPFRIKKVLVDNEVASTCIMHRCKPYFDIKSKLYQRLKLFFENGHTFVQYNV